MALAFILTTPASPGSPPTPAVSSKWPLEHVLPGLLSYTKVITSGCVQHNHQGISDIGSRVDGALWVALGPHGPQATLHVGGLFLSRCIHSQGIHAPLSYLLSLTTFKS